MVDVWSRKVVAWDVADHEEDQIAADLVSRACLRERISKGRRQRLILHADNGNAVTEGFHEAIAGGHPGEPAGGAGCPAVVLQAEGQQRQPLLGVAVPHREIPAGLPPATIPQRGRDLLLGLCIRGLGNLWATSPQRGSKLAI